MERNWQNIFNELESDPLSTEEIDYIIENFLVPHKIDPDKFCVNYAALLREGIIMSELSTKSEEVTHSIIFYRHPDNRDPAFPLWFYAAYPDIIVWFQEYRRKLLKSPSYVDDIITFKIMTLFGLNNMDEVTDEKKILNAKGKFKLCLLKNLVSNYTRITEQEKFETQIDIKI